jgi:hypothetical protein
MTELEFQELVDAFKALQKDYEAIGFRNDAVYARACRALDTADRTMEQTKSKLRIAEGLADAWANRTSLNE